MPLFDYFKEITISWKLSLSLVLLGIWPISAYLIFHFEPLLFTNLDLSKLTLLSCAIASPFLVVNSSVSYLLLNPRDEDLKRCTTPDQLLSSTVLIGVVISLWVLSFGAIAALMDCSFVVVKLIMLVLESAVLVTIVWSKIIEDKRYKHKQISQIPSDE